MERRREEDAPFVATAFLERLFADRAAGRTRSLNDYQALYPGHEALIAREYAALTQPDTDGDARDDASVDPHGSVGPYRVEREIGRGGQGAVYLAIDERLGRRVALKLISHVGPDTAHALDRFRREAIVASRLNHPGICKVHDSGVHGGHAYIAMEHVEGETLARRIERASRPPQGERADGGSSVPARDEVRRILELFEQVARALDAAHGAGVIHRDIKPANIMITPDDRPVLLDFGLARQTDGDLRTLTRTGDFFGTPAYVAPELLSTDRSRPDHRADIWGVGVCLHECLTLRRPFEGATREQLYQAILTAEATDLCRANTAVPRDVRVVVETCLAKEPDRRYQSAGALADDLRAVLDGRTIAAKAVSPLGRAARWARRRPAAATLLAVLVVGVPAVSILGGVVLANYPRWQAQARAEARHRHEAMLAEALGSLVQWNFAKAIPTFRAALESRPESIEALGGLALAHLRANDPAAASAVLDRRRAAVDGSPSLRRIRDDARADADRADEVAPSADDEPASITTASDAFLLGLRALLRREVSRAHTAAEAYDRFTLADELHPHEPRVIHDFGRVVAAIADGGFRLRTAARRIARVMATQWPDHHLTHYALGLAVRDDADAIRHLERCIADRPDFVLAYAQLSFRLVVVDAARALEYADVALARAPAWPWAHAVRARALRYLRRFDAAVVEIGAGIRKNPSDPALHVHLGRIWVARRDWDRAAAVFEAAIPINPRYHEPLSWLGYVRMMQRRYDDAMAAFRASLALAPDEPWTLVQVGRTLSARGERAAALERFDRAIELEPEHVAAYRLRARERLVAGDVRGAEADYRTILRLRPGDRRATQALAKRERPAR